MEQREIKFKYYFQHEETGRIATRIYTLDEIENRVVELGKDSLGKRWFVFKKMQCTGLTDLKGQEIYEGDIVIYFHNIEKEEKKTIRYKSVIEWCDGGLFCKRIKQEDYWTLRDSPIYYQIIGNIFEDEKQEHAKPDEE